MHQKSRTELKGLHLTYHIVWSKAGKGGAVTCLLSLLVAADLGAVAPNLGEISRGSVVRLPKAPVLWPGKIVHMSCKAVVFAAWQMMSLSGNGGCSSWWSDFAT